MRSKSYASPQYHQLGLVLNIDVDEFENVEGVEVLINDLETMYCFPEEIKIYSNPF